MDQNDLIPLLNRLGILPDRANRRGWVQFRCPLAQWTHANGIDRRPSAAALVVPQGISVWSCQGCHRKGVLGSLIADLGRYRQADYRDLEASVRASEETGIYSAEFGPFEATTEAPTLNPLEDAIYQGLWPDAWTVPEAQAYLRGRGIGAGTSDRLALLYDTDARRILFPVRDRNGGLHGFSGRAIEAEVQPKIRDYEGLPKRALILGAHLWQAGRPVVIVEGLFGYAHFHQIGVDASVNIGALLGSALTDEKAEILRQEDAPVHLLLDNDLGGENGLFGAISPEGVRQADGAISLLRGHLPVMVPSWPLWDVPGEHIGGYHQSGDAKTDPDQLTRDEVFAMLRNTPPFGLDQL